jgi:hypothetical protein
MIPLKQIETEAKRIALNIGAEEKDLPTFGESEDGARPHIEVDKSKYHYVVVERGKEFKRESTEDIQQLLYWIFSSISSVLAFAYELKNRVEDQDCRRIAFRKKIEIMELINPEFGRKSREELEDMLKAHPYDDEPTKKVNRMHKNIE